MRINGWRSGAILAAAVLAIAAGSGTAFADRPAGAGGGRPDKHPHKARHGDGRGSDLRGTRELGPGGQVGIHFGDRERLVVREYYGSRVRAGHCPPGLAKKGTGCLPPGQAKKWSVGRPLPRDVVYHELPPAVVVELGVPPPGHRYVRVAADILLIAIGTGIVLDAIEDLGGL